MASKIQPDYSTPLSSLNITPTPENIAMNLNALNGGNKSILPKIFISSIEKSTTPPAEGIESKDETKIEKITPKPSPVISNDRDTLIIQNIVDAKSKLDEILISMKLNLPQCFDKSPLFRQPKTISPSPSKIKPCLTLNSVNRRLSSGGNQQKTLSPGKKYVKPIGVSKIASMIKGDTPRPISLKNGGIIGSGTVPKQTGKSSSSLVISTTVASKLKKTNSQN